MKLSPVNSCPLESNIPNTVDPYVSYKAIDQVSQPYTTGTV